MFCLGFSTSVCHENEVASHNWAHSTLALSHVNASNEYAEALALVNWLYARVVRFRKTHLSSTYHMHRGPIQLIEAPLLIVKGHFLRICLIGS